MKENNQIVDMKENNQIVDIGVKIELVSQKNFCQQKC